MSDFFLSDTTATDIRSRTESLLIEATATLNIEKEPLLDILQHAASDGQATLRLVRQKPLAYLAQMQNEMCAILGQYWETLGTEAFLICDRDVQFCWPASASHKARMYATSDMVSWFPIKLAEQVVGSIGVVGIDLTRPELRMRIEADAALLTQLLTLAMGLAETLDELYTNKQIKKELELAGAVQKHLLSQKSPRVKGLDFFATSLPAMQIGGDFYSFHAIEQRPFLFTVGDVSGKGLKAALLMSMAHVVLDSAARFIPSVHPKALLNRINEDLYNDFSELGMFATIFAGSFNLESHQLTYANNGHAPVIYHPVGSPARLLEADGPPTGVLPYNLSENITLPFHPGDLLVVATDGFNEALNRYDEMFGYERMLRLTEQLANYSAEQIASTLFREVQLFSNGVEQCDDQTLVILKGAKE